MLELDLRQAIAALGIRKPVKVRVRDTADREGGLGCSEYCGDHHRITLYPSEISRAGGNNHNLDRTLLHELVHCADAENSGMTPLEWHIEALHGNLTNYADAPHEVRARLVSEELYRAGIRIVR